MGEISENLAISIRPERPADYPDVAALIREAFATEPLSDQREHLLVERLRRTAAYVPDLALVAEGDGLIIGHILLTKVNIRCESSSVTSLALAPISVLPAYQGRGVGSALMRHAHRDARRLGYGSIVLIGHADYYPRFGYERADQYGIRFPFEVPPENAMVVALREDALAGVSGEVVYPAAFLT